MKIDHVTGTTVETDNLPDVDAILMEESKKLHALFAKYNRQLFLVGEMKGKEDRATVHGCVFFHIGQPGLNENLEAFREANGKFYGRIDGYIRGLSNHQLGIGQIPPPAVKPWKDETPE